MKQRRFQVGIGAVVILGVLSVLNACGGGSGAPVSPLPLTGQSAPQASREAPSSTPSAPAAQAPAQPAPLPAAKTPSVPSAETEIPVSIRDNTYDTVQVKAGTKVVFVITNTTEDMHTFEAPDFAIYKEVQPGETVRFPWTVSDRKGTWDLGCYLTTPGGVHDGMDVGKLIIE